MRRSLASPHFAQPALGLLTIVAIVLSGLFIGTGPAAQAAGGGRIAGTIFLSGQAGSSATAPAGDVVVEYSKSGQPHVPGDEVPIDANGKYEITGLTYGDYVLYVRYIGSAGYASTWIGSYPNEPGFGYSISVRETGIPFSPSGILYRPGVIRGTVLLGATTVPAAGSATVSYYSAPRSAYPIFLGSVVADSGGYYETPVLAPGHYLISTRYTGSESFQPKWPSGLTSVFVDRDATSNVVIPALATLSGRVFLGDKNHPAGAGEVTVTALYGSDPTRAAPAAGVQSVSTDSAGNYRLSGLPLESAYVGFRYNGIGYFQKNTVSPGSTYPSQLPLEFVIDPAITVSGRVFVDTPTSPAKKDAVKVTLSADYDQNPTYSAFTDSAGAWSIRFVEPGSYNLCVEDLASTAYGQKCWQHQVSCCYGETISIFKSQAGFDMTLGADEEISGVIQDAAAGVGGANVRLTGYFVEGPSTGDTFAWQTTTNSSGYYSFGSLPESEMVYELDFAAEGYAPQGWDGVSRYYVPDVIDLLDPSRPRFYNATMYRSGSITGKLSLSGVASSASGSIQAEVVVFDFPSSTWVGTGDLYDVASDGSYRIDGLFPDSYKLRYRYRGEGRDVSLTSPSVRITEGATIDLNQTLKLPPMTSRLAGADRYAVGVSVSQELNPDPVGTVPVVYLASGEKFPDALSAAPAAVANGGPLLLTPSGVLPADVRAEIVRLSPDRIVIVGGTNSVSPAIEADLLTIVGEGNVDRLGGADRYAASRSVIADTWAVDTADFPAVYVATGANFPDAISASAAAGASGAPVLLVQGNAARLDPESRALIESMSPGVIKVAGGSVGPAIRAELETLAPVDFLGGTDRFTASQTINADAIAKGMFPSGSRIYVTTGYNFPDGLVGAALAGAEKAPLYTVPGYCIPAAILAQAETLGTQEIVLLGGTATLTSEVASLKPCVSGARSVAMVERGAGTPSTGPSVRQPGDRPALRVAPNEPPR